MIIVSQEKGFIINFERIELLQLDYFNDCEYCGIIAKSNINDDDGLGLGVYKTEERAKEVLQEIIKAYKNESMWFAYEMPEE